MIPKEYVEFLESLRDAKARYLVVGGWAVAVHGHPRATKDLDVLVEGTPENARRVAAAVRSFFGGHPPPFSAADFENPDAVVQFGLAPRRIDVLNDIAGVPSFDDAWRRRLSADFGGVQAPFLSIDDLMRAKKASARPQDLADLKALSSVIAARRKAVRPRGRAATVGRKR